MFKKGFKRMLPIFLAILMLLSALPVMSAQTQTSYQQVTAITSGKQYVLAMPGMVPVDMPSGTYSMLGTAPAANLLGFEAFGGIDTPASVTDDSLWVITEVTGGYTVAAAGQSGKYLNVTAAGISLGSAQTLSIEMVSGQARISATISGTLYFVRFTNSSSVGSAYTSGTKTASSTFNLYEKQQTGSNVVVSYQQVTAIISGQQYVLAMPGLIPVDMPNDIYSLLSTVPAANLLGFEPFRGVDTPASITDAALWVITEVAGGYNIAAAGQSGKYLNITSSGLSLGDAQTLTITLVSGQFRISASVSGSTRYVRFTNSSSVGSAYTAGTNTASSAFNLYLRTETEDPGYEEPGPPEGDPLFTLGFLSDLHVDYGIQNWNPPLRLGTIRAINTIKQEESLNAMMLTGDLTSNNAGLGWSAQQFANTKAAITQYAQTAVPSGRVMYITGNHDFVAGGNSYNSGDYSDQMLQNVGEFAHVLYQSGIDKTHILGYHYVIDDFDVIGINTPYTGTDNHSNYVYDASVYPWLQQVLTEIGADRTVFLAGHYPLRDSRNISSAGKGMSENDNTQIKALLLQFPNVIYLYGHDHGGKTIANSTFERVTPYRADGSVIQDYRIAPTSFVTSFVGSMGYYSGSLSSAEPAVVQALMIYVYSDRVVLQTKNYGDTNPGAALPEAYTILRDMSAYVPQPPELPQYDSYANEPFTFTAETPLDARGLTLLNEDGKKIGIASLTSQKEGDKQLIWTVSAALGTPGEGRHLQLRYFDSKGQGATAQELIVNVAERPVEMKDLTFSVEEAVKNEIFTAFALSTSSTKRVKLFNETDHQFGTALVRKTLTPSGDLIWEMTTGVGTAGARTIKAVGYDKQDQSSDLTATGDIIILAQAA